MDGWMDGLQNQNQNSLLVKRQNAIPNQGIGRGRLVPSRLCHLQQIKIINKNGENLRGFGVRRISFMSETALALLHDRNILLPN